MDRQRCIVTPDRVDIRASCRPTLLPAAGLILAPILIVAFVLWQRPVPGAVSIPLVLVGVVLLALSGLGLLYSAVGVHVVADRAKESVLWQRGLPGIGLGTRELVSFWKIRHLEVEETVRRSRRRVGRRVAQFEVALVKTSGRRLPVGVVTVPRSLAADGMNRARLVADAIAGIAGKRVVVAEPRRRRPRVVRPHYLPSRR